MLKVSQTGGLSVGLALENMHGQSLTATGFQPCGTHNMAVRTKAFAPSPSVQVPSGHAVQEV